MFLGRKKKKTTSSRKGKITHPSAKRPAPDKRPANDDKQNVSLLHHEDTKQDQKSRRWDELVARLQARKFNNKIIDLLGYKGMTNDRFHYLKLAGSVIDGNNTQVHHAKYAELLKIGGTGIADLPEEVAERLISSYISFWRSYFDDLTCICLPLPNNSKEQQNDWQEQIDRANQRLQGRGLSTRARRQLIARRKMMGENLTTLQNVDKYLINQGFLLMVFAKNERELTDNVNSVIRLGEGSLHLSRLRMADKELMLKHINNPGIML